MSDFSTLAIRCKLDGSSVRSPGGWMDGWMDGWLVGWLVGDVVAMPTSPSTLVSSLSIHSPFLFARLSVDTVRPRRSISGHLFACSARALIVIYGFSVMLSRRTRRSCQSRVEPPPPRAARWDSAFKTPAGRNGDTTASLCTSLEALNFLRLAIRPRGPTSETFRVSYSRC